MIRTTRVLVISSTISLSLMTILNAQPVWVSGTPQVISTDVSSLTVNYGIDRTGTVYIIVFNYNNTTALTSSYVRSRAISGASGPMVATSVLSVRRSDVGASLQVKLNIKNPGQIHTIYIVAANNKGKLQALPVRLTASTLPCSQANAGSGGTECDLDFTLNARPGFGIGTWSRVSGSGSADFSPDANTAGAKVTVSSYGTYVFRWTETQGICNSFADISVNFIQQTPANAGNGGDECDKDFNLKAVTGSGTGFWSKVNGPGNATFSPDANQPEAIVSVTVSGAYDFAWEEVSGNCLSSDIIRVVFHGPPPVDAGSDVAICSGNVVQLNASGSGSFLWTPSNNLNDAAIYNPVATPLVTSVFTVTLTDEWGCINSDKLSVEVKSNSEANAGNDQILEYSFETTLEATDPVSGETGRWSVLSGNGIFSDINDNSSQVKDLSLENNSFVWSVSNGVCPPASDTVNILVKNLIVPTLITPNMDGKNDKFIIRGLQTMGITELVVFNRWGARVYSNKNYSNNWDGRDDNGNLLQNDTYFYVLKPEKTKPFNGYIVIRQ